MSRYSGLCERDMRILWKRDGCGRTRQAAPLLLRPLPHRRHARAAGRAQRDTVRDDARRPVAALEARHTRRRHHQAAITIAGRPASSTDPATWCAWWDALGSTAGDGLGFALGGGFACIDLDHCYDRRNHLTDWAKMLLAPVEGRTYIETSPSGRRAAHLGTLRAPRRRRARGLVTAEAYSRDRYMTVTGRPWHHAPATLADLTFLFDVIERLR